LPALFAGSVVSTSWVEDSTSLKHLSTEKKVERIEIIFSRNLFFEITNRTRVILYCWVIFIWRVDGERFKKPGKIWYLKASLFFQDAFTN